MDVDDLVALFTKDDSGKAAMIDARRWVGSKLESGGTVRALRLAAGLSQKDLALATGMRQPNICAIETGNRRPDYENARRIAKVLNVDVDSFYRAFELASEAKK